MKKTFFIFLQLLIALSIFPQNKTVIQLDSVLTALYKMHAFNGTALYAEKGKVLYKKAFGVADFRTGKALQTNSAFNLASDTKQFICMCIMILAEHGDLSFDDDITKYIPELSYRGITVRNLMNHTSGIPEYFDYVVKFRGPLDTLTNEKLIALYAELKPPLDFATGSQWNYSNTNYVLLSSIIERISKMPVENFIRHNISDPLGLKETYMYHLNLTVPQNHVYGFAEENGKQKLNDLNYFDGVTGDGNMYSSVEDLFAWEQSLYTEKLVKKSTLAQAFTPVKLTNDSTYPYGFGWFVEKENELMWHTGGWVGFVNIIYRDIKNNRTLIVLSSSSNPAAVSIARKIFTEKPYTLAPTNLISNVWVIDGTNTPARKTSVRIQGERIIAVGDLVPFPGEAMIDGAGKILTPGFIDTHSHLDETLNEKPGALAAISQGITTVVGGQDGYSFFIDSLKTSLEKIPVAVNVATYTGQTTLREIAMGTDLKRTCTNKELQEMKDLLKAEMEKGSLGLSTGLEYEGSHFSNRNEVIELAKVSAAAHGRYISHLRSEDIELADAIDEIINIGREAKLPVQISHFKIALKDDWGSSNNILSRLEAARQGGINITADCYPYEYWSSTLRVLFPKTDFTNLASAEFAVNHTFDANASVLTRFAPNNTYKGKTIGEIAAMRNETPAQTLIGLIGEADAYEQKNPDSTGVEGIMGKSMIDEDVKNFLSWANTNICSDGTDGGGHPRGYGAFTRVLSEYVRNQKIMSLENAVYKMTSLAARHTGIAERGIIAPGYYADLVLLDSQTVKDNATIQNPTAVSDGIIKVWVNGVIVYENKQSTTRFPGKFITRGAMNSEDE